MDDASIISGSDALEDMSFSNISSNNSFVVVDHDQDPGHVFQGRSLVRSPKNSEAAPKGLPPSTFHQRQRYTLRAVFNLEDYTVMGKPTQVKKDEIAKLRDDLKKEGELTLLSENIMKEIILLTEDTISAVRSLAAEVLSEILDRNLLTVQPDDLEKFLLWKAHYNDDAALVNAKDKTTANTLYTCHQSLYNYILRKQRKSIDTSSKLTKILSSQDPKVVIQGLHLLLTIALEEGPAARDFVDPFIEKATALSQISQPAVCESAKLLLTEYKRINSMTQLQHTLTNKQMMAEGFHQILAGMSKVEGGIEVVDDPVNPQDPLSDFDAVWIQTFKSGGIVPVKKKMEMVQRLVKVLANHKPPQKDYESLLLALVSTLQESPAPGLNRQVVAALTRLVPFITVETLKQHAQRYLVTVLWETRTDSKTYREELLKCADVLADAIQASDFGSFDELLTCEDAAITAHTLEWLTRLVKRGAKEGLRSLVTYCLSLVSRHRDGKVRRKIPSLESSLFTS
eukprot:TRINITY_DN6276_c0_g2_i3.p1 TRINITY_DN6276_c0_g2~~TRINITY_DN6276_c0_g2_i3.p1  ORF type:complete len:512 (-),score=90.90 TRINITY_DN6276_c0_g2_i3:1669-3204(-)